SLKVTVPVGVPAPGLFAATVAVKVTGCPNTDGWTEEVSPVVVPGRVVVVVDADVVVEVVAGGAVVVENGDIVVVVGGRAVVVVVAVVGVEAGRKVASTMNQLVAAPRVRLPSCGPPALDKTSSRSEEALPLRTSRTYGTRWLLPGIA